MPIIKSAKKRVRTAEKAAIRNSKTKRSLKTALKAFRASVTGGDKTTETHAAAVSNVYKPAKKNLIHKNKAARIKSKLARDAKAAAADGVKPTATKKPAAKKPAKTTTKPAAKKPAAKKAPAKKPAAKK